MVTPPDCDLPAIPVVQVKVSSQLSGRWVCIIAAIAARLLVGKELYRHVLLVCSTTMAVQAEKQEKLQRGLLP